MGASAVERFNGRFLPYARQSLMDWRARHPLRRVVEPLPTHMHTHTEPTPLTDYEKRQREKWNCYGK